MQPDCQAYQPTPSRYHFSIEIDSVTIAQFQEVSGIASELDVIELKQNTATVST